MAIKVVVKPNPAILAKPKTENPISTAGTVFVGSSGQVFTLANNAYNLANTAYNISNTAILEANSAFVQANSAYNNSNTKLSLSGGEITGNLIVDGTFIAIIDGGNNGF